MDAPKITQVEMNEQDQKLAETVARRLGYEQTAYTTCSALWGLFCLPENPEYAKPGQATRRGCIIKTQEMGLLFVAGLEELGFDDLADKERRLARKGGEK